MSQLHAVLYGNMRHGFTATKILPESQAHAYVEKLSERNPTAFVLPIDDAKDVDVPIAPDGTFLVVMGEVSSGFRLVGPFETEDEAVTYGEATTGDLEEYSGYGIMELTF